MPERWTIYVCPNCDLRGDTAGPCRSCPPAPFRSPIEVVEVVEPGHDEQTEDARLLERTRQLLAVEHRAREAEAALATERERTVAAVVEALRETAAELAPNEPAQASGVLIGIDRIENDPRFKPSAPGGGHGH